MKFYLKKNVLVAGGTGMVGQQLVEKLIKYGANVFIASKDNKLLANKKIRNY